MQEMMLMQQMTEQQKMMFMSEMNNNRKNATTAVVLALFLGGLGAHHFYGPSAGAGFRVLACARRINAYSLGPI